jgi:DNA-binding transcriptional ArsR family regulator
MTITLHLTPNDLVNMRFAYRPMLEIPLSYRVLRNPEFQATHQRWTQEAYQALHDIQLHYLDALIAAEGYIPDFLTPTPTTNHVNIEDDLTYLLSIPHDLIRKNIQRLIDSAGDTAIRRFFLAYPNEAMQRLAGDLRIYWQRTLAYSWSRMIAVLEGDILYRGRLLALDGPNNMISDLHPSIDYSHRQIHLKSVGSHVYCSLERQLRGDGIRLVPTIFTPNSGRMLQISPEWQPMILYGARGMGLYPRNTRASESLELALGAGRASVLQALMTPATTAELAHALVITSSAVSQHLKRLTQAGLVEAHRSGKRVFYQLTQRGEEMIALFDRTL